MKAEIEIECKDPELIIRTLKPDIEQAVFTVQLEPRNRKLYMVVNAKSISNLLAGINSYLRLIRTTMEINEM